MPYRSIWYVVHLMQRSGQSEHMSLPSFQYLHVGCDVLAHVGVWANTVLENMKVGT